MPYVTAAIEAEDPFLNHATNGIDMYGFRQQVLSFQFADGSRRMFHEDYPNVIKSWDFPADASLPRNYTPREPVPFFQLKFPYNLVRAHVLPMAPVLYLTIYVVVVDRLPFVTHPGPHRSWHRIRQDPKARSRVPSKGRRDRES